MMRLVMMISESGSQGRKRCGMMMDGQGEKQHGRFGNFDNHDDDFSDNEFF